VCAVYHLIHETLPQPMQATDGQRVLRVSNGHPTMQLITATGCTLTAVMAAFLATNAPDPLLAAAHAMAIYGCAYMFSLKVKRFDPPRRECIFVSVFYKHPVCVLMHPAGDFHLLTLSTGRSGHPAFFWTSFQAGKSAAAGHLQKAVAARPGLQPCGAPHLSLCLRLCRINTNS